MEYQGIVVRKDENDQTKVIVLNIEKLAETIVVRDDWYNDEKTKEALKEYIFGGIKEILDNYGKGDKDKSFLCINFGVLVPAILSV